MNSNSYYFHVQDTPDGVCALICPIAYYVKHGCLSDYHLNIEDILPDYMEEMMESMFLSPKSVEETRKDMLAKGFLELAEFSDFCDGAFEIVDEILACYPETSEVKAHDLADVYNKPDTWLTDPLTPEEIEALEKASTEIGKPW